MDANDYRKAVISAIEYMAFFDKQVVNFNEPIEVEGKNGKMIKVQATICFQEVYEDLNLEDKESKQHG